MEFQPLHYSDRLTVINPAGDVGIAHLWSTLPQIETVFRRAGIDLSPESSRVAVMANLYGNGLKQMLRNLLYNPQIRFLVLLGNNLFGIKEVCASFFANGIEEVEFLGAKAYRIIGTNRQIDGLVTPDMFGENLLCLPLGHHTDPGTMQALRTFFDTLPPQKFCTSERVDIPLEEIQVARYPSEARSHVVTRVSILEAYVELLFRLVRFGHTVSLKKGKRRELQDVKVVIEQPDEEPAERLAKFGLSADDLRNYQRAILDPHKPDDLSYTYGNRLAPYLPDVISRLREDPESRHAFIDLWDNVTDLRLGLSSPCLASVYFRRFEGKLTLNATYRTHNAVSAWVGNIYAMMTLLRFVAGQVGMESGPITVTSLSISIDPDMMEQALAIAGFRTTDLVINLDTGKKTLRLDPSGEFLITSDPETGELVAQHMFEGFILTEYRGKTAEKVENQIARDEAISLPSHAMYVGRMLAREEIRTYAFTLP